MAASRPVLNETAERYDSPENKRRHNASGDGQRLENGQLSELTTTVE